MPPLIINMSIQLLQSNKKQLIGTLIASILLGLISVFVYLSVYGIALTKSIWMFSAQSFFVSKYLSWFFPGFMSALIVGIVFCYSIGRFFPNSYFSVLIFLFVLIIKISQYLSFPLHWTYLIDWASLVVSGFIFCFFGNLNQRKAKTSQGQD
ncbi:MAG: hypothetical protein CSA18_04765 [Deltaproteobacteria bacterium]|nr:MAG: hypothetical protein CSA18_04765 [Deltaproteobacteria bacterium]